MMIDVVRSKHNAREFRQQIIFFVGCAIRPDDSNRNSAISVAHFAKAPADRFESLFPCGRRKLAVFANQRLRQALFMVREVESVSSLNAKEIAIDPTLISIIATDNLRARLASAHAQSRFG